MRRNNGFMRVNERGNMLIMTGAGMTVLAIAILIGLSFANLFFVYNRLQTSADEIALAGARALNQHDQIGQMNNMIARCRQLVYTSEQNLQDVNADYPQLARLASELRDEDRQSALTLESQRNILRAVATGRAQTAMITKFNQLRPSFQVVLPWLQTNMLQLMAFRFGRLDGIESNVSELSGINNLDASDRSRSYIEIALAGMGLNLYKEGIDARLPGANTDLIFKLSSLPAPVQALVSPARVSQASAFQIIMDDQIPSATQVKLSLNVATSLGISASTQIKAIGTAVATGASPQQ